jgi:hypothetical protein
VHMRRPMLARRREHNDAKARAPQHGWHDNLSVGFLLPALREQAGPGRARLSPVRHKGVTGIRTELARVIAEDVPQRPSRTALKVCRGSLLARPDPGAHASHAVGQRDVEIVDDGRKVH